MIITKEKMKTTPNTKDLDLQLADHLRDFRKFKSKGQGSFDHIIN